MKNIFLFAALVLGIVLFNSCGSDQITCIRASSNIITENRGQTGFKGVLFNQIGDLKITQGPDYSVKITGPDNVVALTTTTLENGLLIVSSRDCFNGSYEILVEVTSPEIEEINMIGVGEVVSEGDINSNILEVNLQGVGVMDLGINADTLLTTISGTGTVAYSGDVLKHKFVGAGDFTLNAYDLKSDTTLMNIPGTGDSYVYANNILDVVIQGTGEVHYKGVPTVTETITGDGEVIDAN